MRTKKTLDKKVKKSPQGKIRLREDVVFRMIDDEAAVVRPEDGTLMILNETGSFILRNLKGGILKESLIKKVVSEYDITKEEAEKDVNSFLKTLEKEGLIEIS